MIYGIGTDIIDVSRIKLLYDKSDGRLAKKILTEHELLLFYNRNNNLNYLAKRYAAKEAFSKALGTGIGKIVSFCDLTVLKKESGYPFFMVSENLRVFLKYKGIKKSHLSLSDEKKYVVATVILEK